MRIRDKIITAACLTQDGIEWTTRKVKQDGMEPVEQHDMPFGNSNGDNHVATMTTVQLPAGITGKLRGDLTASMRTSELLMRTMEFPTADHAELAGMVDFQIDKISPFPLDQLAVSHEVLQTTEKGAMVLMVAVRHDCIDKIGDTFGSKGIHIHSMDARVLGWLDLIKSEERFSGTGTEILIIYDNIDFALTVVSEGVPVAFRSLCETHTDEKMADELAYEVSYTLTALDAEHDLPAPSRIDYWSFTVPLGSQLEKLGAKMGLDCVYHDLASLPPLSEGIIDRAFHSENRIELIPHEWIEHVRNKRLRKKFTLISSIVIGIWLSCILIFFTIYQVRAMQLKSVKKEADAIAPAALKALENRKKLNALKIYTDRSNSSLECLREVTRALPPSDIEFVSYNFNKGKGEVAVRGTAGEDDTVYDFFGTLSDSKLFTSLQNQSVNTRTSRGVKRTVFSVTLAMPSEEEEEEQ